MASRFWVGGTGTWDNADTTHWSVTDNGAGGASVPASTDTVTFNANSGGGTVTVAATINASNTLVSITCGAFTGTLTFATNNPSITLGTFSISGTGTRTINLGSGTFTITTNNGNTWDAATVTNLTFSAGTSTILFSTAAPSNNINFVTGSLTYNNVTVTVAFANGVGANSTLFQVTGTPTIGTLTLTPPCNIYIQGNTTISTALVANGTSSSNAILLFYLGAPQRTITLPASQTFSWMAIGGYLFTNSPVANNSFDLKGNSGITINAPSGGGGVVTPIGS